MPDNKTKQAIQTLSNALPISSRQRIATENWHITLVFIGFVEANLVFIGFVEANLVSRIIAATTINETPAITLVFDQLEYWRKSGIVCVTCSQIEPAVTQLISQLSTPLLDFNLKLDTRPYCPHLTLARRVSNKLTASFQPIHWIAQQVVLLESISSPTGISYQLLQFWQLAQQNLMVNN